MFKLVTSKAELFYLLYEEVDGESIWWDFVAILDSCCVDSNYIPYCKEEEWNVNNITPGSYSWEFEDNSVFMLDVNMQGGIKGVVK